MANNFQQAVDDNRHPFAAVKPRTGATLLCTETTTVRTGTTDSAVVRIVAPAAINYAITTSTTDAVTTSDVYLPANTIEFARTQVGVDRVAVRGSTTVYVMTVK